MHSYPIAEARRNLPSLIREAEKGETVRLTRRGEPVAVLVGLRSFERLTGGRRRFTDALRDFATDTGASELALDPDELFGDLRDPEPGRDVWP